MKRLLIDYKKLDHGTVAALRKSYPYGYGDDDIITLQKANGDTIEVVELKTKDTIYMVKIGGDFSRFRFLISEEKIDKELDQILANDTIIPDEQDMYNDSEST